MKRSRRLGSTGPARSPVRRNAQWVSSAVAWTLTAAGVGVLMRGNWPGAAAALPEFVPSGLIVAGLATLLFQRTRSVSAWRRRAEAAGDLGRGLLWEAAPDGRVTYASPAFAAVLGHDPGSLVGQDAARLVAEEQRERVQGHLASARLAGSGWQQQHVRLVAADGTDHVAESSALAVRSRTGRVVGFTGIMRLVEDDTSYAEVTEKVHRLRHVIQSGHVDIVAQPIVDIASERVIGAELLSRFTHSGHSTEQWFLDAADVGFLEELELLAVRKALGAACQLPVAAYASMNVSSTTLVSLDLQRAIEDSAFDPSRIVLELTEHDAIDDYAPLQEAISRLRGTGIRLAVDDAGAGYASFRHILRLRPDFIKLDRAIVSDIHMDAGRRALAAAIVMFALEMNAAVVAEGVETPEEYGVIATLGIDAAQGYLLQRPTEDRVEWAAWADVRFVSAP